MAKKEFRFTKKSIDALNPASEGERPDYWDTELKGH